MSLSNVGLIIFGFPECSLLFATDDNGDVFWYLPPDRLLCVWLCTVISEGTSEPFGVVFDRAKGGAITKAAIDHRINSQEVCHGAGKETSIWVRKMCRESKGGD